MLAFAEDCIRGLFGKIIYKTERIDLSRCVLFLAALVLAGNFQTARAAEGDLDATFGAGGKVVTNFAGDSDEYGRSILVQPDGKIIVAGQSGVYPLFHAALARYNDDGSLDQTFGIDGKTVAALDDGGDILTSIVLQPNGKIVAAGALLHNNSTTGLLVARFNADGSLDQTFGNNGRVVTTFGNGGNVAGNGVVLQPDGKIIVAGSSGTGYSLELSNFALARYNTDGSLDQTFGSGGKLITHFEGGFNTGSAARSVALQPDGKIVVTGNYTQDYGVPSEFAVVRYNTDGALDSTFGSGGKVITALGGGDSLASFGAIQPDGKIVVAGYLAVASHNHDFALARYNADGSLDPTFGSGGKTTTDLFGSSDDIAYSLAVQSNGKIVAVGRTGQYPNFKFGLARYNANGSLDQNFGSVGKILTEIGGFSSQAYSVAQANGKVVVAGYNSNSTVDFVLARYLAASAARPAQFDFDGDARADISVYRGGTWYLNRSTAGFSGVQFGLNSDALVPADFDGDGKTDTAVFRDGAWYFLNSSNGQFRAVQFGQTGDVPVPADYDGDGKADAAVFRAGVWYFLNSLNNQFRAVQFGISTDKAVPADYDGDGRTDVAVYRDGTWYWLGSADDGFRAVQFGVASDVPVVGDFDGDGRGDQAVYRSGTWYLLRSQGGFASIQFGAAGDVPVAGDYDGDGKADVAVFRQGVWYLNRSTQGFAATQFGTSGDRAVPAAFVP